MIVDDISAALPELQAQAESLMRDLCVVRRPGAPTTDPDTGDVTPTWLAPDPVYAGRWKRQTHAQQPADPDVSGAIVPTDTLRAHFPVATVDGDGFPVFRVGDVIFWATADANGDPVVAPDARMWRVTNVPDKTWQTAIRLPIEVHSWT